MKHFLVFDILLHGYCAWQRWSILNSSQHLPPRSPEPRKRGPWELGKIIVLAWRKQKIKFFSFNFLKPKSKWFVASHWRGLHFLIFILKCLSELNLILSYFSMLPLDKGLLLTECKNLKFIGHIINTFTSFCSWWNVFNLCCDLLLYCESVGEFLFC